MLVFYIEHFNIQLFKGGEPMKNYFTFVIILLMIVSGTVFDEYETVHPMGGEDFPIYIGD